MSYEHVDFDRTPIRQSDARLRRQHPHINPAAGGSSRFGARPHLSLVPEAFDVDAEHADDDDQWQERALCAQTDPEAFFPEKGGSTREAKRICLGCEVRDACLDYALAHDERFGIWGGLSERERRRLKRGII